MQTLNLARAKRVFKKADPFVTAIDNDDGSVAATWAIIEFINAVRADIRKVAELEAVDFPQLVALCTNNARRHVLLQLINKTADHSAVAFVTEQLNSGHPELVRSAAKCLEAIGTKPARESLEAFCNDPAETLDELSLDYARKALATFSYDAIPPHVFAQLDDDPATALAALGNIQCRQATDILLEHLPSKDNACRLAALKSLEGRPEEAIIAPVTDYVLHGAAKARLDALQLLSNFSSDQAVRVVSAVMRNGRSVAIRKDAALALGKMQNPLAVDSLLECLDDSNESADVVAAACISLKKLNCADAVPRLTRLVAQQPLGEGKIKMLTSTNLYALATEVLHSLCGKDATEPFAGFLDHPHPGVRMKAMHALRQRKCAASYEALAARLAVEGDRDCVAELNKSVKALGKFAP